MVMQRWRVSDANRQAVLKHQGVLGSAGKCWEAAGECWVAVGECWEAAGEC